MIILLRKKFKTVPVRNTDLKKDDLLIDSNNNENWTGAALPSGIIFRLVSATLLPPLLQMRAFLGKYISPAS